MTKTSFSEFSKNMATIKLSSEELKKIANELDLDGKEDEGTAFLQINNGDLIALKQVMEKYNMVSEEAVIRFALAVLIKSNGKGVYVENEEDKNLKIRQVPGETLLKKPEEIVNPE